MNYPRVWRGTGEHGDRMQRRARHHCSVIVVEGRVTKNRWGKTSVPEGDAVVAPSHGHEASTHPLASLFEDGIVPLDVALRFEVNPVDTYLSVKRLASGLVGGRLGMWETTRYGWRGTRDCAKALRALVRYASRDPLIYSRRKPERNRERVLLHLRERVTLP